MVKASSSAPNKTGTMAVSVSMVSKPILAEDRDGLQQFLTEKGIGTGLHYPLPLHPQKACARMGFKKGDFPVSERTADRLLSLPMFAELTSDQIEYVAECIREYVEAKRPKVQGARG